MGLTCGEATMRLLARYGVSTVFGIPGVHTLEMCRGLTGGGNSGEITHVRARNEQGAGFMAEGWARATGEVGVALVISGPGVTNTATALGQCYADSLPFLLISAEPDSNSLGKGRGALHEITSQKAVTAPLCAFSETVRDPEDVPHLIARAFTIFASERPRPCHISIPTDIQAMPVTRDWLPVSLPRRPLPQPDQITAAAALLAAAKSPLIQAGGGAIAAAEDIRQIAELLDCPVVMTVQGKGIVPDDHPLAINLMGMFGDGKAVLEAADVVLAIGTEMAETDSFLGEPRYSGQIIRVDIDARKLTDNLPATIGIHADAAEAARALRHALPPSAAKRDGAARATAFRAHTQAHISPREAKRIKLLSILHAAAPRGTVWSGEPCQIVYTGCYAMPVSSPRSWFYPAGFCSLGNGVPNAIGAKLARPDAPVVALVGDGGFMFTMPEILTAVDLAMPLPIILWDNGGYQQIKDGLDERGIDHVGVDGINPDFAALARACHCHTAEPRSAAQLSTDLSEAFSADRPTLIIVREDADWL